MLNIPHGIYVARLRMTDNIFVASYITGMGGTGIWWHYLPALTCIVLFVTEADDNFCRIFDLQIK